MITGRVSNGIIPNISFIFIKPHFVQNGIKPIRQNMNPHSLQAVKEIEAPNPSYILHKFSKPGDDRHDNPRQLTLDIDAFLGNPYSKAASPILARESTEDGRDNMEPIPKFTIPISTPIPIPERQSSSIVLGAPLRKIVIPKDPPTTSTRGITKCENLSRIFPVLADNHLDKSEKKESVDSSSEDSDSSDHGKFVPATPMTEEKLNELVKEISSSSFMEQLEEELDEALKAHKTSEPSEEPPSPEFESSPHPVTIKGLEKEAEKGNPDAMFRMATMYHHGNGVEKSRPNALIWYKRAIENGCSQALTALGMFYLEQNHVHAAAGLFLKIIEEQFDPEASYQLGVMYEKGHPFPKNETKAFVHILNAKTHGHSKAINRLGLFYLKGKGTPRDEEKAFALFQEALKKDDIDAMHNYAYMYHKGLGVEVDYSKAYHWYTNAAERGNRASSYYLGVMYEEGQGVEINLEDAKAYYLRAAKLGHINAMNHLGRLYRNSLNFSKAKKWFKRAADRGHPEANYNYGNLIFYIDCDEGIKYLSKAIELGYSDKKKICEDFEDSL